MGITGVTSYSFNTNKRITGLASNLDTDTLVKQMMQADTAKYTKILQNRQISEWKIESYREITSTLQSFYKEYFDTTATKKLKSADSFSSFSATYAATNSTNYITVTPTSGAKAGTYTISNVKAATAATLSGKNVTKPVEGLTITDADVANIKPQNNNNIFILTFNNVTKEITLNDKGDITTVEGFKEELQEKINEAFGSDKINVILSDVKDEMDNVIGKKFSFSTVRDTDSFSIGVAENTGATELFKAINGEFSVTEKNNKFRLTIDGVTKIVSVATGTYENADKLAEAIENAAEVAFGSKIIEFTGETGKVECVNSGHSVSIEKTTNDASNCLGLNTSNLSSKIDLNKKIFDIKDSFATTLSCSGTGEDIVFTINGKYFRFNSKEVSINDIIKKVNADTTINATMKYDITTNSFKIESKKTGQTTKLEVVDKAGNFMSALGITGTEKGTDASVTVNGVEIVRSSNTFTYDGLTFNIKNDYPATDPKDATQPDADPNDVSQSTTVIEPIKVTVSSDPDKALNFIKEFVDKYNEIIKKLNDKISEKRYKDYLPLTDEQEAAMTDKQVEKWEEKAKSGLLRNDSIISNILTQMRSALYAAVEGCGITLTSIGITTSSNYEDKGKLILDEDKLKEALVTKSEEIARLFTSSSDITYYDAINSLDGSKLRSQRYKECGIAHRISDIIQDAIRTTTDRDGYKGTLLEKAGIAGDRSETKSVLAKELLKYDEEAYEMNKKLTEKENALYKKYAAMESALNKLYEQQNWLVQQLGGF